MKFSPRAKDMKRKSLSAEKRKFVSSKMVEVLTETVTSFYHKKYRNYKEPINGTSTNKKETPL